MIRNEFDNDNNSHDTSYGSDARYGIGAYGADTRFIPRFIIAGAKTGGTGGRDPPAASDDTGSIKQEIAPIIDLPDKILSEPGLVALVALFAAASSTDPADGEAHLLHNDPTTMMKMCLAVGPKISTAMRLAFLKDNANFLKKMTKRFFWVVNERGAEACLKRQICRHVIREWMKENSDWKSHCTSARIEEAQMRDYPDYIVFNSPALAIKLGLVKVLRHLVEEKGIDINCKWATWCGSRRHLVRHAIDERKFKALSYLLSCEDIHLSDDIMSHVYWDWRDYQEDVIYLDDSDSDTGIVSFNASPTGLKGLKDYLQVLYSHPKFRPNEFIDEERGWTPLRSLFNRAEQFWASAESLQFESEFEDAFFCQLAVLLSVGADPDFAPENTTVPSEYVRSQVNRIPDLPNFWASVLKRCNTESLRRSRKTDS